MEHCNEIWVNENLENLTGHNVTSSNTLFFMLTNPGHFLVLSNLASCPFPPSLPLSQPWWNPKQFQLLSCPSTHFNVVSYLDNPDNLGLNTDQTPSTTNIGTCPTLTLFPLIVIISHCLIPSHPVLTILVHTLDSFTLTSLLPLSLGYET